MTKPFDKALSNWLDGSEPDSTDGADPLTEQSCQQAAESLLIHGLLSDLGCRDEARDADRIRSVMRAIETEPLTRPVSTRSPALYRKTGRRIVVLTSAMTVAAAVLVMFVVFGPQQNVSAAMASLEKVLDAAMQPFDRTYEIRVVEEYPRDKRPRNLPKEVWQREVKEQIDGAKLYVRGADRYVFVRKLKDGRQRISGCDGEQSWAFREDGPVHVSSDLNRFRGGLPGQQQDIPFINMHLHLTQLQTGYDVELMPEYKKAADGTVLSELVGARKSRDVRGPKQIKIWFDADNGTVHQMLLDGLPRGRGGPKCISLELVEQADLGPSFFSHQSHHEPGRRVRDEELKQ